MDPDTKIFLKLPTPLSAKSNSDSFDVPNFRTSKPKKSQKGNVKTLYTQFQYEVGSEVFLQIYKSVYLIHTSRDRR